MKEVKTASSNVDIRKEQDESEAKQVGRCEVVKENASRVWRSNKLATVFRDSLLVWSNRRVVRVGKACQWNEGWDGWVILTPEGVY